MVTPPVNLANFPFFPLPTLFLYTSVQPSVHSTAERFYYDYVVTAYLPSAFCSLHLPSILCLATVFARWWKKGT